MNYSNENVLFFPTSSEQRQCWKYHRNLIDRDSHQILIEEFDVDDINIIYFDKAISMLYQRHSGLRTFFKMVDEELKQGVVEYNITQFRFFIKDLSDIDNWQDHLQSHLEEMKEIVSRVDEAPLMRILLVKLNFGYKIFIIVHHIIADHWSLSLLIRDYIVIYNDLKHRGSVSLPKIEMDLKDYAIWQDDYLKKNGERIKIYWRRKLSKIFSEFASENLEKKHSRINYLDRLNKGSGYSYRYILKPEILGKIKNLNRDFKIPVSTILYSSFHILFHLVYNRETLMAMSITNRYLKASKNIIGALGGGIYLSCNINDEYNIEEILSLVNQDLFQSLNCLIFDHDEVQLDGIPLRLGSDIYLNYVTPDFLGNALLPNDDDCFIHEQLEYPEYYSLSCFIREYSDGILLEWKYNSLIHSSDFITSLADLYFQIITKIIDNTNLYVSDLKRILNSSLERINIGENSRGYGNS